MEDQVNPPDTEVTPPADAQSSGLSDRERVQQRLERLAWALDSSIRVPLIGYRIGPESLLGLIPGVGDAVGGALSLYLINLARQLGAPKWLLAKMLATAGVDLLVGAIPLVGDLFDFAHRANAKIARMLVEHLDGER